MYVLAPNQVVEKFPYSIGDLRKDNPQVSFPKNPSVELLASYNVFPVVQTEPSFDEATQIANAVGVKFNTEANQWQDAWEVRDLTAEELQARDDAQATLVRRDRDNLLAACDWTQAGDIPQSISAPWAAYRQELRDIPQQAGFPWNVQWPVAPSNGG